MIDPRKYTIHSVIPRNGIHASCTLPFFLLYVLHHQLLHTYGFRACASPVIPTLPAPLIFPELCFLFCFFFFCFFPITQFMISTLNF